MLLAARVEQLAWQPRVSSYAWQATASRLAVVDPVAMDTVKATAQTAQTDYVTSSHSSL